MWKHVLDPPYTTPIMVWPYSTIWEEELTISELLRTSATKSGFDAFWKLSKIHMSRCKISLWNHSESKEYIRNISKLLVWSTNIKKLKQFFTYFIGVFEAFFMQNSLIKSLRKKFIFSKSNFQPASYKYVSGVLFRFRMISQRYFGSRRGISIFFKKVSKPLFEADLLTSSEYSTFSSQIVRYGQTIIGTL